MGCKYAYYKNDKEYFPRLYCKVEDSFCIYSKRCNLVEKFVQIENFKEGECYRYVMEEQKNIPQGANFVTTYRPNKKGKLYLYVAIDDKVEKILSDLDEINQNYVYLKDTVEGYKVSLTPFENTKRTYSKKK